MTIAAKYEDVPPNPPACAQLDSLIAATALVEGLTLATKSRKHFQMIGDLKLEARNYW